MLFSFRSDVPRPHEEAAEQSLNISVINLYFPHFVMERLSLRLKIDIADEKQPSSAPSLPCRWCGRISAWVWKNNQSREEKTKRLKIVLWVAGPKKERKDHEWSGGGEKRNPLKVSSVHTWFGKRDEPRKANHREHFQTQLQSWFLSCLTFPSDTSTHAHNGNFFKICVHSFPNDCCCRAPLGLFLVSRKKKKDSEGSRSA